MNDTVDTKRSLVICGWKRDMSILLESILAENSMIEAKNIVVIANVDESMIETVLRQNPQLHQICFIRGDYLNDKHLLDAGVNNARRIIIVADESNPCAIPVDIDMRTVTTANTIRELNHDAPLCVELMDNRFKGMLKNSRIDEILCSNELTRWTLCRAGLTPGYANIINDILNGNSCRIRLHEMPDGYIGRSFNELKDYFAELKKSSILIGLMENVGDRKRIREEAIRDAQKTYDFARAVNNLKKAKNVTNYSPNINPDGNYLIPRNTLSIVMESKSEQIQNSDDIPANLEVREIWDIVPLV